MGRLWSSQLLGAETEGLAFAKVFLDRDKDLNF